MTNTQEMNKIDLSPNEALAIERTVMANERSLLAYVRTFVVFLSSGIALLKIELFQNMRLLAYFLITFSIVWLIGGIIRFVQIKKVITKIENSIRNKQNK